MGYGLGMMDINNKRFGTIKLTDLGDMNVSERAREFVKEELGADSSGHDWWHIYRVTNMATKIAGIEQANVFICELAALLHDIADEKLNESKEAGLLKVSKWLEENAIDDSSLKQVMEIISSLSYLGGNNKPMATLEGRIVQDADRLDALGAVGIARTFAYAGWKGQLIYDPSLNPRDSTSIDEYRSGNTTAINHFYEKLLKLKDMMNTEYAKTLAQERHQILEDYLKQFYEEWNYNGTNEKQNVCRV